MAAFAGILLFFAFRGVKWHDFVEGLRSCNFWWIGASMTISILAIILRGWRWRLLMLPLNKEIKRTEAYDGVTIAYLTNLALPRAGEFARCGVIAATKKTSFEKVFGTVVFERSIDMLSYLAIATLTLLINWSIFGTFVSGNFLAPLKDKFSVNFVSIVAIVGLIFIFTAILLYIYRKSLANNKFFAKIFSFINGLFEGLKAGFKMQHKGKFWLYTLLINVCYWGMSMTTILALPSIGNLSALDALFLMVVGSLGWIVPVQGGIGAYHLVISLTLASLYGIAQTEGVIFATISHESQILTMLICGCFSLLNQYFLKKHKTTHSTLEN